MPMITNALPLSLYIHIPWCVRKCPYCDFNSHEMKQALPEELYVNALLQEIDQHLSLIEDRPLISIFFGGGTPSLFSGRAIAAILDGVAKRIKFDNHIEITLEANPGTIDEGRFQDFYQAGVNRLSLGIQSLQDDKLKMLGRIHDHTSAIRAIQTARQAFNNFNLDLMFGLPNQTISDVIHDLQQALDFSPTHLSWYQLTIEPNTYFYRHTPVLPQDELIWEMQQAGQSLLREYGFKQYEVSAYSQALLECKHNRNYWEFGDYLGIGAGAHSKITCAKTGEIKRFSQVKHPRDYLDAEKRKHFSPQIISEKDLIFEFMLNALRLTDGVRTSLFTKRTGISLAKIQPILQQAQSRDLLIKDDNMICPTELGKRFLNDLIEMFL
ncbi:MAG: hypothetical protein ACD_46C00658G0008 [uncultured bacterium]|nr:MAG: hypothetical protein ACD_46C00658G0008 [uncultured bacterium]